MRLEFSRCDFCSFCDCKVSVTVAKSSESVQQPVAFGQLPCDTSCSIQIRMFASRTHFESGEIFAEAILQQDGNQFVRRASFEDILSNPSLPADVKELSIGIARHDSILMRTGA
jgi:hypothetical protein